MPSKTTAPVDREQLEAEAARLNAQLAAIREQDRLEQEAAAQRRAEAQAEWDRQFLATLTPADLESDVDKAAQVLDEVLATNSLVLALSDFLTALRRRSNLRQEISAARMRLGQDPLPTQSMRTEIEPADVLDLLLRPVNRMASDRVAAEVADLYTQRDDAGQAAAGTDTNQES